MKREEITLVFLRKDTVCLSERERKKEKSFLGVAVERGTAIERLTKFGKVAFEGEGHRRPMALRQTLWTLVP